MERRERDGMKPGADGEKTTEGKGVFYIVAVALIDPVMVLLDIRRTDSEGIDPGEKEQRNEISGPSPIRLSS